MRTVIRAAALFLVAAAAMPAAAQPQLRVGLTGTQAGNLDPHRATATEDSAPVSWMFNGLLRFPPGSADPAKLEPDLAESMAASPDGLTWTFRLRPGVKWHDGQGEVTAEDVVQSLRRAADPKRSSFSGEYRDVASVDAVDARTVKLVLRQPVPSLPGLVSNYHGGLIVPARLANEPGFGKSPVGTGPFMFTRTEAGATVLTAFPGYFRGAPKLAGITVRYLNSDQTRELALTAGEIDLMLGRREQRWVQRMRAQPGIVVDVFQPGEFRTVFLNAASKPLDDVRVRRAVAMAIDVAGIVKFVGPDVATQARSAVPVGHLGHVDVPQIAYDPAGARALLAEAGHKDGITLKAVVSSISAQLPIMEVIQAQLKRAGITLDLEVVDHATYHARIRQDLSQVTFYGAARFPVADSYLSQFYHSRSAPGRPTMATNFGHCSAADAEIDAARSETVQAKQLALWATAQQKIADAVCTVPLFDLLQVWARTDRLDYGYTLQGSLNLAPPITQDTVLRAN